MQSLRHAPDRLGSLGPSPRGPHLTDLERVLVLARATLRYALDVKASIATITKTVRPTTEEGVPIDANAPWSNRAERR